MNGQPEMDELRRREALAETSLSFLGVGIRTPPPSWGSDMARGCRFIRIAAWLVFMPGIAILLTTLAFTFIGDDLRDALDPRQARQGASTP